MPDQITPGLIDQHACHAFLYGACGGLAIALHDTTGWPIVTVLANDGIELHYMVRNPATGHLVDITGSRDDDDVLLHYEFAASGGAVTLIEPVLRDHVWDQWQAHGDPYPMNLVHSFVSPVLDHASVRR
ncbi:hypothetical protein ACFRCX_30180 [Streptomyces sp. NPDC056652]|uniref:hypothetical protein n=1 Tax=Streptomyces sp. NPDC056652 TaxID=3345893 RepID=UPI003674EE03